MPRLIWIVCCLLSLVCVTCLRADWESIPDISGADMSLESLVPVELTPQVELGPPIIEHPSSVVRSTPQLEDGPQPAEDGTELITERYPNRSVKIQRYVRQDVKRNYVNHGQWTMYDPQGKVVAQGSFVDGKRHGPWMRLLPQSDEVDSQFQAPYLSEAEFHHGQLNGTWTLTDANRRMIASWDFERGQLQGRVAAWYPSGQQRNELSFSEGQAHGIAEYWNAEGQLVQRDYYRRGNKMIPFVKRHDKQQLETEGWLSRGQRYEVQADWWEGVLVIEAVPTGEDDQKTGIWRQWYANGTLKFRGKFDNGQPVGPHTWWHPNGQRQQAGEYLAGQPNATWISWHENGLKSIEGEFANGDKRGRWTMWDEDGRVAQVKDFNDNQLTHDVDINDADS